MSSNYDFKLLTAQDLPILHQTFLDAFADYLVPIQLNEAQFKAKLKREGVQTELCGGAFYKENLAGFILTGLGEWQGKYTAYNAGTGVVPQHRGHALTRRLYEFMLPAMQKAGVKQCLLEVIKQNVPALKVYQSLGFKITRTLDCFRSFKEELILHIPAAKSINIRQATQPNWPLYKSFWDITPTWQNTPEAITRSTDPKIILEAYDEFNQVTGYVVFYPHNGAIAQLAVSMNARGKGIGTALLREVARLAATPALMLINIDTAGEEFIKYLENRGLRRILMQYEMVLPIG
ncbi:GNAT family N-acetyltransferase [Pontibacter vulgaris]|uniref:GNAT family N-acetyltransferase n=1 Tax=Pontibacter vulgaris TaxID=2905679 RepID=UPI001FA6D852|nr:GNAT family N-acetyltransferase [Pontibacter vulgaris]